MLNVYPYISRNRFSAAGRAGGINEDTTFTVRTQAVGKARHPVESPYLLANEYIAASIAQYLRLPVPPFAMVRKRTKKTTMFLSYDYDGDTKPGDVDPELLYAEHPHLCTGITLFDVLVANCDRHGGNLKVDNPSKPRHAYLIDHDRALFYVYAGDGVERLDSRLDRLGVTDGAESGDEWHCLVPLLDSPELMSVWVHRIKDLPDWFIDDVCDEAAQLSLKKAEVEAVKAFLKHRRASIDQLLLDNTERFPAVQDWPLFL